MNTAHNNPPRVIPAQAGIQSAVAYAHIVVPHRTAWIPAFAGMRVTQVPAPALPHTCSRSIETPWSKNMGDIQSIEKAVEALPPSELAEFRRWFAEFDAACWDAQIEDDANAGKLDALAVEVLAGYDAGSA